MISSRNGIIFERGVQQGFENLQIIWWSKSQKHVIDTKPACKKLDRSLQFTNNLYAIAARLKDANSMQHDLEQDGHDQVDQQHDGQQD